ncbi:MAG: ABC transporter ATP-binding protein [Proteobacteria bacterium]|nr:ABC transporter ATP-binding protein [Pseudomonadota bacterium]
MNQLLSKSLPSFIWHFIKPYQSIAFLFVMLTFLAGFWGPFNSILIKHIINLLPQISQSNLSLLIWPATLIVINFIVFDNFTWRSVGYVNYKYQAIIKNQIISQVLNFVLGSSHQYFQDNLSGRISNQITTLADNVELILHRISMDFIRGASLLIVSFITAYFVNPMFFYIMVSWFIAFTTFSVYMSRRLVYFADIHAKSESVVSGQLVDCITNQSNVRIFSRRNFEISRMLPFLFANQKAFQAQEWFILILNCVQGLLIAIMMGFSAFFLVYLYGKNAITIGDFALIFGLSMELGHMMWYTMSRIDEFNQAIGKCKQSLNALIIPPEIFDKSSHELSVYEGKIEFQEVKFQYKDTKAIFQNKSVKIEAGQKVGLVGHSGGGKSTFVNLILRLYDITQGRILIDNQNICEVTQNSLRQNISMIPQDPSLFHRSLMDNIRYGRIEATDEEVIKASQKAHAHEFISKLQEGYNALVGERGIKLSGGQRQRIAIARAFLKNAPILILDEATSQLDSLTEQYIQESLWELMQGKTTLVIAHRLSTLLHMDRILVFDQGIIVEDGTHQSLLSQNGAYAKLWKTQIGGFLLDEDTTED